MTVYVVHSEPYSDLDVVLGVYSTQAQADKVALENSGTYDFVVTPFVLDADPDAPTSAD